MKDDNNLILHYDCISEFKRQYYKDLITFEHLRGGQIKLDRLGFPDGSVDDEANFWGWVFEKDSYKYLLSSIGEDGQEVKLKSLLPMYGRHLEKVASKGVVYHWIRKPVSAKFKAEKRMSLRQLIDTLSSLGHTNPRHQKLMWMVALSAMWLRAYYRISTPAGFGKDSTVDILGNLIGGAGTVEKPTIAKLEERAMSVNWLAVNEVVDIAKPEWMIIEQFLLAAGAFKPEITKHSRAFGGVGETIDISNFSLTLMYNDIDHYKAGFNSYFDAVTKEAVLDRFPPFRFHGRFVEDFNIGRGLDVSDFVKRNIEKYRDLIYTYTYFKQHLLSYGHKYQTKRFDSLPQRHKQNIDKLLQIVDAYCETQDEFAEWVEIIAAAMHDYYDMLKYPSLIMPLYDKAAKVYKESEGYKKWFDKFTDELKTIPLFNQKYKRIAEEMAFLSAEPQRVYVDAQPWNPQSTLIREEDIL